MLDLQNKLKKEATIYTLLTIRSLKNLNKYTNKISIFIINLNNKT
jgi:hypothetical protein